MTITWLSNTSCGQTVDLHLLNGGAECLTIASAAPNTGQYSWIVAPCGGGNTEAYTVRVTDLETAVLDESDASFAIQQPDTGVYYVAPDGDNSHPGSIGQPWRTIQHAAETVIAGEIVYIRAGTYNEHVHPENSGSSSGHIVFSAYPGETPVIDGTGVTDRNNAIVLDQAYIRLVGLEICNWNNGNAIWAEGAAHLEISDCVLHDVEFGLGLSFGTHDFQIDRVLAHHFDYYGFDVSPDGADCYNGSFNDCVAHTGRDPELGHEVDGFATSHQGNQRNITFNRCEAHDVGDGFVFGGTDITANRCSAHHSEVGYKMWGNRITVINSLSYHNETSNLELDWDEIPGATTLRNCTLMDAEEYNIWIENVADTLHMYNCIVAGGDNITLAFEQEGTGNYHGDYNLFHADGAELAVSVGYEDQFSLSEVASGAWTTYSGQDANSVVVYEDADIFVSPSTFDLHLIASSPAVDHGTLSGAPPDDFDGNPRPTGGGCDIGAYEFQSGR